MSRYPFPVPFGWFQVAWADQVQPGEVMPRYYFARHLVLWRDGADHVRAFADSKHVIIAGHGHGQIGVPCVDRVMAAFIKAGTAKALDTSCTQKVPPMPFFITLAGPAP